MQKELAELTLEDFLPLIGQELTVEKDGQSATLKMAVAEPLRSAKGSKRTAFSLLFHGPLQPAWPQGNFLFNHPELGSQELFTVPIAQKADHRVYEVIFT